jgi:hypothetical protein
MAEIDDLTAYYQNLLIMQYHDKSRARDTIGDVTNQTLSDMVFTAVRDCFDLETAVGAQLDTVAKYLGLSRYPLGESIDDGTLRFLIKMKIVYNNSDMTLKSINDYINTFFGDQILVVDNADMSLTYEFNLANLATITLAANAGVLPRPAGVAIILAGVLNPNGDFGFSFAGTADAQVNGYGVNGYATYEGGTYERIVVI